jgi:hypothetical protein
MVQAAEAVASVSLLDDQSDTMRVAIARPIHVESGTPGVGFRAEFRRPVGERSAGDD